MAALVPVINLGGPTEAVVGQVQEACTRSGFFLVANHGVPPDLVERHRLQQRRFFVSASRHAPTPPLHPSRSRAAPVLPQGIVTAN